MLPIKVGILVSYDYERLKTSLPQVYDHADKIVLAVDKDSKTWAGSNFLIPETFFEWVREFDMQHKIEIYRDSFYVEGLAAMQCETRERNMLAKQLGKGGWHVQIDVDEYFIDFGNFVNFLHRLEKKKPYIRNVRVEWLTLFKKGKNGYLFIKSSTKGGAAHMATTNPSYIAARNNGSFQRFYYPYRVVHDSFARTEQELQTKLKNWGHNNDFDTDAYLQFWKSIDENSYKFIRNASPVASELWELDYVEAKDVDDLLRYFRENPECELLKNKAEGRVHRLFRLCVPPIFLELKKLVKNKI